MILPIKYCKEAADIVKNARDGTNVSVFGLSGGERTHITSCLDRFFVYVVNDHLAAKKASEQLTMLVGCAPYLPSNIDVLTFSSAKSNSLSCQRQKALYQIVSGKAKGIVITADALCQLFGRKQDFLDGIITISKDEEYDLRDIGEQLITSGYQRETLAEAPGQWSLRGDILDIFPIQSDYAIRVEFFGDKVETIRRLDIDTLKSVEELERVVACPVCSIRTDSETTEEIIHKLKKDVPKGLDEEKSARYARIVNEIEYKLKNRIFDSSLEFVLPFIPHSTLADFLPKDSIIVYDECKALLDTLLNTMKEHKARYTMLLENGEASISSVKQMLDFDGVKAQLEPFGQIAFHRITSANNFFTPKQLYNFNSSPVANYSLNFKELGSDLKSWIERGYKVALCAKDAEGCTNIQRALQEQGLYVEIKPDTEGFWDANVPIRGKKGYGKAVIVPYELDRGITYHDASVIVIGTYDIFKRKTQQLQRRANFKQTFLQPEIGDYVVHSVHGIGRCDGVKRINTSLGLKDYVVILYRDNDKLYVPVDQMDMLSKYTGTEPRLSKMGGEEFSKVKERVSKGIKTMAVDLLKLYSVREKSVGFEYKIDNNDLKEFTDSFEYQSTPDQITAIEEILEDMRSPKIMDRLLVGDVGYGKTEVALRAVFASVLNGRQAAILAPTTILCQQHFLTASKRFEKFGVRVGVLNRFCTASEQAETIKKLSAGEIDLICGTHRLLSKDVVFKDLGLLILDEEQRFGVSDKEKIKALKATVDVLTMTATPIPRTLHMSMSGIRDISTLENPPENRFPVQTFVTEYTESLATDVIRRELTRGGQVFVVYNRVETIDTFAYELSKLLPEARIITGHGQMSEAALEKNIEAFYEAQADVLVSTTIIENGIDLANANSMLVVDADRLGLSQLYQLRGRVGRSNRLAYAYFTYRAGKNINEVAYKRLNTLLEFTEFGSGFKIAMRDLEIRGAGNVLGREQHGHMEKVGYDLYLKLLAEEISRLKGEAPENIELECRVDVDFDAYIPSNYVSDDEGRMKVYSRIAAIRSTADREQLLQDLKDIYGNIPKPLQNLINVGLYKGLGVRSGCEGIKISKTGGEIRLRAVNERVATVLDEFNRNCVLKVSSLPTIIFTPDSKSSIYESVFKFLLRLAS